MLTIPGAKRRLCDGLSRRQILKIGALSVGGLTLADLLRARAIGFREPVGRLSDLLLAEFGLTGHGSPETKPVIENGNAHRTFFRICRKTIKVKG